MNGIAALPEFDNHESVSLVRDNATGLRAFIAVHNTNLGPAVGGTRYWQYASEEDALKDALRLSRAMAYKCALAGVPYGGGKAVIIRDGQTLKNNKFLKAYAKKINLLGGNFFTGEDVGMVQKDVDELAKHSSYIIGRRRLGGDPAPWAAMSTFQSLRVALKEVFGSDDLVGRTVAIKGLGKVGFGVAQLIAEHGGTIVGADTRSDAVRAATQKIKNMKIVDAKDIHKQKVDVYSPNALGADIDQRTIPALRCSIVCGGANNQLASDRYGVALQKADILYIPDYVANAGGLINVVAELHKDGYSKERVQKRVIEVGGTVQKIIALSKKKKQPTNQVADELARQIFMV